MNTTRAKFHRRDGYIGDVVVHHRGRRWDARVDEAATIHLVADALRTPPKLLRDSCAGAGLYSADLDAIPLELAAALTGGTAIGVMLAEEAARIPRTVGEHLWATLEAYGWSQHGTSEDAGRAAPHKIAPELGWRAWIASHAGLRSTTQMGAETWWPTRHELVAACHRWLETPRWLGPPLDTTIRHDAPFSDCTCGIYAAAGIEWLSRGLPPRPRVGGWASGNLLFGRAALWGTVIQGEHTWRASHAYPHELAYVQELAHLGPGAPLLGRGPVERLAELYGVPAIAVPARDLWGHDAYSAVRMIEAQAGREYRRPLESTITFPPVTLTKEQVEVLWGALLPLSRQEARQLLQLSTADLEPEP